MASSIGFIVIQVAYDIIMNISVISCPYSEEFFQIEKSNQSYLHQFDYMAANTNRIHTFHLQFYLAYTNKMSGSN
jgi:hypothetical protein